MAVNKHHHEINYSVSPTSFTFSLTSFPRFVRTDSPNTTGLYLLFIYFIYKDSLQQFYPDSVKAFHARLSCTPFMHASITVFAEELIDLDSNIISGKRELFLERLGRCDVGEVGEVGEMKQVRRSR